MYRRLGALVSRHWLLVILLWIAVALDINSVAPLWDDVTHDGDIAYLPARMASVAGAELYERAFPDRRSKSEMAVVVARPDQPLSPEDRQLADLLAQRFDQGQWPELPITEVWSPGTEIVGEQLVSEDGRAALVVIRLTNEFMAVGNIAALATVQRVVDEFRAEHSQTAELQIGITGSAAIGGNMLTAAKESIDRTEVVTVLLVVTILILVYRAPLLIFVPLTAIIFSIMVSTDLVALLTQNPWIDFKIFKTTQIFVVVILYGSGTDYCLFLISRYKEQLEKTLAPVGPSVAALRRLNAAGLAPQQWITAGRVRQCGDLSRWQKTSALADSLGFVGDAIAASALTTVLGLGMMFFADFGKFRNSGPAIGLCLVVQLIAALTLAPALLRSLGRAVYWPFSVEKHFGLGSEDTDIQRAGAGIWGWLAGRIVARPGTILIACVVVLSPLAAAGWHVEKNFDLLSDLRPSHTAVRGTRILQQHFPPGEIGPITILAYQENGNFDDRQQAAEGRRREGYEKIYDLTVLLHEMPGVSKVRSRATPFGEPPRRRGIRDVFTRRSATETERVKETYIAQAPEYAGEVTLLDVVPATDPFSKETIALLDRIDEQLLALAGDKDSLWHGAQFYYTGTTAGIRDMAAVIASDERRIQQLVALAVLMVLIFILRRPIICGYLIVTVIFSYLVTIGATESVFRLLSDWHGIPFQGLDWKVSVYLFVILVAVGEDYNIYLVTRVFEEQRSHTQIEGLRRAVIFTGGIITSCGLIMAGSFVSMLSGTLTSMQQLGFALPLGVMLDTFVIRPVLVPCFMAILYRRGGRRTQPPTPAGEPAPIGAPARNGARESPVVGPHAMRATRTGTNP